MSLQENGFYEFGPFRLKPSERLLLPGLEPISLPPKAFETLLLLVKNSGHVLSKGELMETLWANAFVEENNLTQQVSQLRRVLGNTSSGNNYIETVPRLGYRFAMPVREVSGNGAAEVWHERRTRTHILIQEEEETREPDSSENSSATTKHSHTPRKLPGIRTWGALGAVAAIALAATYFLALRSRKVAPQARFPRTLAVLPFRDLKPGPDTQFLGYSLADAIIGRLGYFPEIIVRPSSYVARFHGVAADPRFVAQELHSEAILTGNYIREGDRLRVSAEFVDVGKAEVLWRDTLDLPYDRLLTIQDRVAENVIRGLNLNVLPQVTSHFRETAPQDPVAYEYYLRGRNYGPPNDYLYSIRMFEKSLEIDPAYAPAWMELGSAYAGYGAWQGGGDTFRAKSQAAFEKALTLDSKIPIAHTLLAIQMVEHGDLEKGLLTLREELKANPYEAMAHWWLAEAYLYGGMLQESIAEGEKGLELDPLVNSGSTFNTYLHAGDYKKFLSTLAAEDSARTSFYRGLCFYYMHDTGRAATEFERAYTQDPTLLHAKYGKAFLYAIQRQPEEGRRYLEELERTNPTADGEMLYKMVQAYAVLGDSTSAIRLLRMAIDHNFSCPACFSRDPLTVSLHGQLQYAELIDLARDRHQKFKREYF